MVEGKPDNSKHKKTPTKLVVLTDLDGTFLDYNTYSYDASITPAGDLLAQGGIIVFVTSKTAAEVKKLLEDLRKDGLSIQMPFVVENGCGIYIPKNLVNNISEGELNNDASLDDNEDYWVIHFGRQKYSNIRLMLKEIADRLNKRVIGFGDLTPAELSADSGLDEATAALAQQRESDEPFYIENGSNDDYEDARRLIEAKGLSYHRGGRYAHVSIRQDKGVASRLLLKILEKEFDNIVSIGIGDAENDIPFLRVCDKGYLIRGEKEIAHHNKEAKLHQVDAIGSYGFRKIIDEAIKNRRRIGR